MEILLDRAGRRFNQEWVFRNLSYRFVSGQSYAVLGANGSGKSTLLSVILGSLSLSEGELKYVHQQKDLRIEDFYRYVSFAAPYLDLIEEFTLEETVEFHFRFKGYYPDLDQASVLEILELSGARGRPLKYFSSGMKQRTRLVLALCSDTPVLVLDEPTSNLDKQGLAWYQQLIGRFASDRLVVVGSNQEDEYSFCNHFVEMADFKG
ncbi:ABC transporter ATP-binding protein [Pedobacter deserti]|uniref:ABC transporter ATP-binding protein n=1 Tax=Pedobacter deserti TaxID=2817382 RepID=UPI00210B83C2|nr:ATP-binding cassette domain-containing protein [Pedobacter sp. SYSU D00382]